MKTTILINGKGPERRIALIENGRLAAVYLERSNQEMIAGSIYRGRVVRVLPGLQAAFVDIGLEKAAFLYAADAWRPSDNLQKNDHDAVKLTPPNIPPIKRLVRESQQLLVQITKAPLGTKGARITTHISLPGRFLVLTPGLNDIRLSRRIIDDDERNRLAQVIETIQSGHGGVIIRTAAESQPEDHLIDDYRSLIATWQCIENQADTGNTPALVYRDSTIVMRILRDIDANKIEHIVLDDSDDYIAVRDFAETLVGPRIKNIELYQDAEPLFEAYQIENEIDRALQRKVWLKSGGSIVFDHAEALTAIDVNSGRYVGTKDLETTITKINREAAIEIAHQLRLRNIGGVIVIDFIDMAVEKNREAIWQTLSDALEADRAQTRVLPVSDLGLVQMTRQRRESSLANQLTEPCTCCGGQGIQKTAQTIGYSIVRALARPSSTRSGGITRVDVHPRIAHHLATSEKNALARIESETHATIRIASDENVPLDYFRISLSDSAPG